MAMPPKAMALGWRVGSGRLTNLPLLTIDGSQRSVAKGGPGEMERANANINDDAGNRADADGRENVTKAGEHIL